MARVVDAAKGRIGYYAGLPGTDDAIFVALIQAGGSNDEDAIAGMVTLGDLLDAGSDECDFAGYARRTLSNVQWSVSAGVGAMSADDPGSWTATDGSAQQSEFMVVCYDPDTTGGTDDDVLLLGVYEFAVTFDEDVEVSAQFDADGVMRAVNPA